MAQYLPGTGGSANSAGVFYKKQVIISQITENNDWLARNLNNYYD